MQPFDGETCPICDGNFMTPLPDATCGSCFAEHRPLKQKQQDVMMPPQSGNVLSADQFIKDQTRDG